MFWEWAWVRIMLPVWVEFCEIGWDLDAFPVPFFEAGDEDPPFWTDDVEPFWRDAFY